MKIRSFNRLFAFIGILVLLSSCSLFRKKNRCNTCPTWHDEVELTAEKKNAASEQ